MIHRASRILLEVVGIAIGGFLVVAVLLVWRLSAAPLESRFVGPYLEQAINNAHLGFVARVTDARIVWHRFRPVLGVQFHGVNISGEGGAAVGAFRDGTLGISTRDLMFGRLSVLEIDIRHPEITIVRDANDNFSLSVGQPGAAPPDAPPASDDAGFVSLLKSFIEQPNDASPIGRLRRVHLVDGRITVDDRKTGRTWSAPVVDIDLARSASVTSAKIDMTLDLPQHPARVFGRARNVYGEGKTSVSLDISDFDAAAAAPFATALSPLAALSVPVSGRAHAVIGDNGQVLSGDAEVSGTKGTLVLPAYYPQPLAIQSLGMKLHFTGAPQTLVLDRMTLDLGDAHISAGGVANFDGPKVAIDSQIDIADLPLARFDALWPHGVAVGGRDWVTTHIPAGVIKSGSVHIAASGTPDDPASIEPTTVAGVFDYSGMEVHYFPSLPPIRDIAGHATFNGGRMDMSIESGELGALSVSKGAVALTGLDRDDRAIDIGLTLAGPLKSALAILDMKPLGYAHDLGLSPDGVGGKATMRANFSFPLVKSLLFSQIALNAKGTLEGVSAAAVVGPRDVSDGMLNIALDKAGMVLNGSARLAGVPLTLDWHESFLPTDKARSRIAFQGDVDDAGRMALALSLPDLVGLKGKVGIKGAVTIDRAHTTTLDAAADLGAADLTVDKIGLRKPPGEPGTADMSFVFDADALRQIPRLHIAAKGIDIDGNVDFASDGAFRRTHLAHVTDPRNDFTLVAEAKATEPHAFAVSITGAKFDAAPLLAAKSDGQPPTHTPRLELKVALDRVLTGAETHLDKVAGTATLSGGRLDRGDLKAFAGGPVSLNYVPSGGQLALHISADDAGQALAALGLTRGVRGGILRIDGTTETGKEPWLTTATLDMKEFRLTDAPIIARLVNAISPTGLVDLLSGQGLGFDHLEAGMDYADGKITFHDGRSAGALGISFEGDVNLDRDTVALKGTVVPVDTFNRIIASIPLVGDMLTGGSRGGLFGWTYSVSGSANDPSVSVDPLSMFAPGFLRNLFFLGPKEPDTEQPTTPTKPSDAAPPANP